MGGVLIRSRTTLRAILEGEGRAWEIFPWIAVVAAASAPVESGRALLLLRVDPFSGIWSFLAMVADRCGPGLVGAVVAALVLTWRKVSFDRAFDTTMFLLVPYLLLAAIGALLSSIGIEIWFFPHRRMTGVPWVVAVRSLVAYGWSLILFGLLLYISKRQSTPK
jgi:hypothetical protein